MERLQKILINKTVCVGKNTLFKLNNLLGSGCNSIGVFGSVIHDQEVSVKVYGYQFKRYYEKEINFLKSMLPLGLTVNVVWEGRIEEWGKCIVMERLYPLDMQETYDDLSSTYKSSKDIYVQRELICKKIMLPLLRGLKALHNMHILHMDIKTDNIMLRTNKNYGTPVLVDFGRAQITDANHRLYDNENVSDIFCGAYCCQSPEMLRMVIRLLYNETFTFQSIGNKSDIYSTGVLLYRLMFGSHPYIVEYAKTKSGKMSEKTEDILDYVSDLLLIIHSSKLPHQHDLNQYCSKLFISFLRGLLHPVENSRFSIDEALLHPFLNSNIF